MSPFGIFQGFYIFNLFDRCIDTGWLWYCEWISSSVINVCKLLICCIFSKLRVVRDGFVDCDTLNVDSIGF
jgi:hypothetical protein